jgi:hypothetical protein
MMENLLNKLSVLVFRKQDGRSFRMICYIRKVEGGFVEIESPTKHQKSIIALSAVIEAAELPPEQIDPSKVNL